MRSTVLPTFTIIIIVTVCKFNFAQENYEIRKVSFHGNHTLSESYLLEGMGIKDVSWLEKLVTKNEPSLYNKEVIDVAMQRLTLIYQSEGFLSMKADIRSPEINSEKQIVKLNIDIEEGKPVLVDTVTMQMTEKVDRIDIDSLQKKLFKKLELTKKKRFRDESLKKDVEWIEDGFRRHGYAYVKVDFNLALRPEEHITDIVYSVRPGPLSFFGETTITGYKNVTEEFLRKQLKYKENEIYNKSLLNETRRNLYLLQLFRVASVLPQTDEDSLRNPIPVKVFIQEAPRLSTNFGFGYGTEDKFRTYLDFTFKGFFGTARRLNLYLKHSALEPYSINLRWIQPQFFSPRSTAAINPFIIRRNEPGFNTRTIGLNIPFTYQFNEYLNSSLTYYFENVRQYLEPDDPEFPDRESEDFPYNKSGILLGAVFNNSNPRFSPKSGESLTVGFKVNGYLFGSEFNYTRLWSDFRIYREIGDWVVAYRLMAGGINSSGFIPVEDRFYSGGANSIRGWYRHQLGPKRESGSPLGGRSTIESNLEFRLPLFWKLSAAAFLDAGNVWIDPWYFRINELAYAAGPGLRVETPIGPVRFDVGFPLWNEVRKRQFFISVGQAF